MRLNGPFPLVAGLLAGAAIVSAVIYFTYRSMESETAEVPGSSALSSASLRIENRRPDRSPESGSPSVAAIPSSHSLAAAPMTNSSKVSLEESATEEVVMEEAPPPPSVPIPGAFAAAKLTNLPGVDQERLADIAQEFADKVKAAGWDTTSPAYHEAWKKAAEESEEVLKANIGVQAWQELKMRQVQED